MYQIHNIIKTNMKVLWKIYSTINNEFIFKNNYYYNNLSEIDNKNSKYIIGLNIIHSNIIY